MRDTFTGASIDACVAVAQERGSSPAALPRGSAAGVPRPKRRGPLSVWHLMHTDDARVAPSPISGMRRSPLVLERPAHDPRADSHAGQRGFAARRPVFHVEPGRAYARGSIAPNRYRRGSRCAITDFQTGVSNQALAACAQEAPWARWMLFSGDVMTGPVVAPAARPERTKPG